MSKIFRSSSSASSRSGMPPDIINEEDCEILENDSNASDQWHMPKIKIDSLYNRTWIQSKMKSLFQVKTIEQTFPVSRTQEQCVLFQKKMIKSFQEKGYKFMHIASVQVAIVPLVRKCINACVLLCLRDGRFKKFNDSVLGIVQTSLIDGPVHFNCYLDLTIDLFDKNVLSTLTLNVKTSGFDMVEDKAKIKSPKNETVLMYSSTSNSNITTPKMLFWKDVSLPDEWVLKQERPPTEVPTQDSDLRYIHHYLDGTVKIAFDQPLIKERRNSFASSRSCFSSDQDLKDKNLERYLKDRDNPTRPIMIMELHSKEVPPDQDIKLEGISTKSQVTSAYYSTKDDLKSKGKSIKEEVQVEDDTGSTSPTASDMVAPVHSSLMYLNVSKSSFTKEEGRKVVKTRHPPLETILVSVKGKEVKASPFKISDPEQNNFVNQTLHTIDQQLDRIEDKVEKPVFEKPASTSLKMIEKPLIVLLEDRSKIHFGETSIMARLDQMLAEVKQEKPSVSAIDRNSPGVNFDDSFSVHTWNNSDDDVSLSDNSLVQKINLLEKEFQGLQVEKPELARIYSRDIKPIGLTKNWYSRPTPPDLQYEERGFHSQFSVSADQMYEWNIDGFSEQEILNTLNRMSMVAIVDILTSGFSGMLHAWWDKHLTVEDRETIRTAIKRDGDGLPILDTEENRREGTHGSPDGVNTLIYTIVKHFVGTPSNITNRISDYLNNLRCNKMSDYRWYKDVFMSRVMLRDDSQKPYWKEKFIDGLPRLFAIKVKDSLTDTLGYLNYDNYTYSDIVSIIQKLGISMCNDQRMIA
ncbi:hypothetical protein I3843_16G075600 [Carya illinoinensis]|nr:hypothetical protein I3843_16G075600 [Carya illinoinensis]